MLLRSMCAVVRLFLDTLTPKRSAVAHARCRKRCRSSADCKMAGLHLAAHAWQCRTHFSEAKGLVTIAQTPGGKAKAVELIPAGCQEVVNKEHLTDPDPAHRGMGVYSAAEATDIIKAPREKRSDGNCSGVTSEA